MKALRVLALVDHDLVPPDEAADEARAAAAWKAEYDVVRALRALGHDVSILGVGSDLGLIRRSINDFKPDLAFNLLECFDGVATWDHNVVAFLELCHLPYSGCNARGLLLARDKALTKKLLAYHRLPIPDFTVFGRGRTVRRPKRLAFPLIVKSLTLDASIGISQASVVDDEAHLQERVRFIHESTGTDAIVERYIDGRELYVGILGNHRLRVLPTWELSFQNMPEDARKIATERVKWSLSYQKKYGIVSGEATDLDPMLERRLVSICKRVSRSLMLSGYSRIDLRLAADGGLYVMEANPNPQLARDEDYARSAARAGLDYETLIARILGLGLQWEPGWLG